MAIKAKLLQVLTERWQIVVKYYSDDVPEDVVDQRGLKTTLTLTVPRDIGSLAELRDLVFVNAPRELLGQYQNIEMLKQYIGQEFVEP